jgi:hypothetical protein
MYFDHIDELTATLCLRKEMCSIEFFFAHGTFCLTLCGSGFRSPNARGSLKKLKIIAAAFKQFLFGHRKKSQQEIICLDSFFFNNTSTEIYIFLKLDVFY